jgi:hypothetical protein
MQDLIRVKVSVQSKDIPIQRQSPGGLGIWQNCQYYFDDEINDCDYWVVIDNLGVSEIMKCGKANTLLLTGEPPSKKIYPKEFLGQFGHIITSIQEIQGPNVLHSQTAIPWHVGRRVQKGKSVAFNMDYDYWSAFQGVQKTKGLSVIASSKTMTEGQRQRLLFVEKLKDHFKDKIDIYGIGFNEISDKWDAIAEYKYHIVLENCSYPDYWSEKLSDCYLGLTFPIYFGCPNISDYFSKDAFEAIDVYDIQSSINKIDALLSSNRSDLNSDKIKTARDLVLNKYNFFPLVTDFINSHYVEGLKKRVFLKPQMRKKRFSFKRAGNEILHWIVITQKSFWK